MARAILSLVIGAAFVIGGLSGKLALKGTNSGTALAVVGGVIIVIGVIRLAKSKNTGSG